MPAPESATTPEEAPEAGATPPLAPEPQTGGPAQVVAPARPVESEPALPPSLRARWPLTLEGSLGFSVRPQSSGGFDDESLVGAQVGLSLYTELTREFGAGLELSRTSLGRGTALARLNSVTIDYSVTSALLGVRAYPFRTELFDVFVGLHVGVGLQNVSAAGTRSDGSLGPAATYTCAETDAPGFQIGGGFGGRLMLTPRWGVTAIISGTGRRLSGEVVDDCARGIGTSTTVSGSLGLGYDFDLDP